MNVFLWIIQVLLAFFNISGGAYKIFQFDKLAGMPQMQVLSQTGWGVVGAFEVVCGILLIVPGVIKRMPILTAYAAVALTLESLVLATMYARTSLAMVSTNPLPWVLVGAIQAAFVAYGRLVLKPLG